MEYVDDCRYNGQWMNGLVSVCYTYNSSLLLLTIHSVYAPLIWTLMGQKNVSLLVRCPHCMQEWYLGWVGKVSCLERCPQFRMAREVHCIPSPQPFNCNTTSTVTSHPIPFRLYYIQTPYLSLFSLYILFHTSPSLPPLSTTDKV